MRNTRSWKRKGGRDAPVPVAGAVQWVSSSRPLCLPHSDRPAEDRLHIGFAARWLGVNEERSIWLDPSTVTFSTFQLRISEQRGPLRERLDHLLVLVPPQGRFFFYRSLFIAAIGPRGRPWSWLENASTPTERHILSALQLRLPAPPASPYRQPGRRPRGRFCIYLLFSHHTTHIWLLSILVKRQ